MIELTNCETCSGLLSVSETLLSDGFIRSRWYELADPVYLAEPLSFEQAASPSRLWSCEPSQQIVHDDVLVNPTFGATGGCRNRTRRSFAALARSDFGLLLKRKAMRAQGM